MLLHIFQITCILQIVVAFLSDELPLQLTESISKALPERNYTADFEQVGYKLYYFSKNKVNWYGALLSCRLLQAFLATPFSSDSKKLLNNYLTHNYPAEQRSWWLSAANLNEENDFKWYGLEEPFINADSTAVRSSNYEGNENSCVAFTYNETEYQLKSAKCDTLAYYICEAENPLAILMSLV